MREEFEAWYTERHGRRGPVHPLLMRSNAMPDEYFYSELQEAWQSWQAAAKAEREACALICDEMRENEVMSKHANMANCTAARSAIERCSAAIRSREG